MATPEYQVAPQAWTHQQQPPSLTSAPWPAVPFKASSSNPTPPRGAPHQTHPASLPEPPVATTSPTNSAREESNPWSLPPAPSPGAGNPGDVNQNSPFGIAPLSALTSVRTPSALEERCIAAVNNPEHFAHQVGISGGDMLALTLAQCTRGQMFQDGDHQAWQPGNFDVGAVVAFPTSPAFVWATWMEELFHVYEVMDIFPSHDAAFSEGYRLHSAGRFGNPLGQQANFPASCVKITLRGPPASAIFLRDTSTFTARRRAIENDLSGGDWTALGKRKAPSSSGTRSTALHTGRGGRGGSEEDDEREDDERAQGLRTTTDADGHARSYHPVAALTLNTIMKVFWRCMGLIKRNGLVPGDQNPTLDVALMVLQQYRDVHPPPDVPIDAQIRSYYGINNVKRCRAVTNRAVYERAFFLKWPPHNWTAMTVLYFLENPREEHLAVYRDNTGQDVRDVIAHAVTGWLHWMSVHFDALYNDQLQGLSNWLLCPPSGAASRHDGLHLLFIVNNLLANWCYLVAQGASATRFPHINFSLEVATPLMAIALLRALETEFLNITAVEDPYPHPDFTAWKKTNTIEGFPLEEPTPARKPQTNAGHTEPAPTVPTAVTNTAARTTTKVICPWHAAFALGCKDNNGVTKECHYGTACESPHVDPRTLPVAAVTAACEEGMRKGGFLDRVLAALASAAV